MRLVETDTDNEAGTATEAETATGHAVAFDGEDVEVRACPEGPLLVRGADAVRDPGGQVHRATRPVVAVCACDKSQRLPWCDGTHKVVRRKP